MYWFTKESKEMGDKYKDYMQSDEWKKKRMQRILLDGGKCVCCGCKGTPPSYSDLDVHHKTYERFGREDVENDLVSLCREHHDFLHWILPFIKEESEAEKTILRDTLYKVFTDTEKRFAKRVAEKIEEAGAWAKIDDVQNIIRSLQNSIPDQVCLHQYMPNFTSVRSYAKAVGNELSAIRDEKIFTLYKSGKSINQIAKETGLKYGTVKKSIDRAKEGDE